MVLFDLVKLVVNDLSKRKFSSFLTLFAISLGILTIFVIFLLSTGFTKSIDEEFEKFGTNRLYVTSATTDFSPTVSEGLDDNLLRQVEGKAYVDEIFPYYSKRIQLKFGNEIRSRNLLGTYLSEDFFEASNLEIEQGRFPKRSERYSVVLGSLAVTDTFDKDLRVGSNVYIGDVKFKVVGILKSIGSPEDDKVIYFDMDTLRDTQDAGDSIGLFDVNLVKGVDVDVAKKNLQSFLDNKFGEDEYDVNSPLDFLESFTTILNIVTYTLGGIGVVALFVGSLGIVNTMYVVVSEKRKDIGIMKAIGAKDFDVLFMFVFQAGLFGFLGGVFGIVMAGGISAIFEVVAKSSGYAFLNVSFDWIAAGGLLLFSFLIGCVSGFLPAKEAADTNLIDAIRKG